MSDRILDGVLNYAKADKSDPFTYRRCMCHYRQGLCKPLQDGSDGHYTAQPTPEPRIAANGAEYVVTIYTNQKRV